MIYAIKQKNYYKMNVKDILIIFRDSDKFFIKQIEKFNYIKVTNQIYYIQIYKANLQLINFRHINTMRPQPPMDIKARADLFLKQKKNITNIKPFATPEEIQERFKDQYEQKSNKIDQIRLERQKKQRSIQKLWNQSFRKSQSLNKPLDYLDPRVRLNQISNFHTYLQSNVAASSQQLRQKQGQKNFLNSNSIVVQNANQNQGFNQIMGSKQGNQSAQHKNNTSVEVKEANHSNSSKSLFQVNQHNIFSQNQKKPQLFNVANNNNQSKPKNIFSQINSSNTGSIFTKTIQNNISKNTSQGIFAKKIQIQNQPEIDSKTTPSIFTSNNTSKIAVETPGNIFQSNKQKNSSSPFSNNQSQSSPSKNQTPSFAKNQSPSIFSNNQAQSLFSNNQVSNSSTNSQVSSLFANNQSSSVLGTSTQSSQGLFKNSPTSNLFANNKTVSATNQSKSLSLFGNTQQNSVNNTSESSKLTQIMIQKSNQQNKKKEFICSIPQVKEQQGEVKLEQEQLKKSIMKNKTQIQQQTPKFNELKQDLKQPQKINIFSQSATPNNIFSQKTTNNLSQPLGTNNNIFSQTNKINLFGNNNNVAKTSQNLTTDLPKPQGGLFSNVKPNLFSSNTNNTGSSLFGQTSMFKQNNGTNMFSAPKKQQGGEDDENGDQQGEDDQILQDKNQIDPTLSTGNYKYTETQVFFKENVAKFKIDNGNLFESVGVSIEQVGQSTQKLIFVRLPNKILLFYGMPLKGKTQIRKMSDKSIIINGCVRCYQQKKSLVLIKMNFKQAGHCDKFFEIVANMIKGQ